MINIDFLNQEHLTQWNCLPPLTVNIKGHPQYTFLHNFGTDSKGSPILYQLLYSIGNSWFVFFYFAIISILTTIILYLLSYFLPSINLIVDKLIVYQFVLNRIYVINLFLLVLGQNYNPIGLLFYIFAFTGGLQLYHSIFKENEKIQNNALNNSYYLGISLQRLIHFELFSILHKSFQDIVLRTFKLYFFTETAFALLKISIPFSNIAPHFILSTQFILREYINNSNFSCNFIILLFYVTYWLTIYSYYEQNR